MTLSEIKPIKPTPSRKLIKLKKPKKTIKPKVIIDTRTDKADSY